MFLQTIIENSIANAGISPSSVIYRTSANGYSLYNEYLRLSDILNRTEKGSGYYTCSTCEKVIKKALTGVYIDIDDENPGQVKLRSLAFEPNYEELELSEREIEAIQELRDLVLDDHMIRSATTIGEGAIGHTEKGGFEHLHLKGNLVIPKEHRPSDIEKYVSLWNRNLRTFNPYDVEVIEALMAKINADKDMPEFIKDKFSAFTSRYLQTRGRSNVVQNHIKWLIASNPAHIAICKFYNTPAGIFFTDVLEGKDYVRGREVLIDRYDSENYQRTIHKTSNYVSEQQMEIADKLLGELDLINSLQRVPMTDSNLSEITEGAIWVHTPNTPLETSEDKGPMSKLKMSKSKPDVDRVVSAPMSMEGFLAELDDYLTIKVELRSWCSLCLYSAQVNQDEKSILRTGAYHNFFSFVNVGNDHYLNGHVPAELELTHLIDIDGMKSFVTAGRFGRELTSPTPLFPHSAVPELHPIRKQIEIWANSTTMDLTPDTVVGFNLPDSLYTVRPKFIVTKRATPKLEQVIEIVMQ